MPAGQEHEGLPQRAKAHRALTLVVDYLSIMEAIMKLCQLGTLSSGTFFGSADAASLSLRYFSSSSARSPSAKEARAEEASSTTAPWYFFYRHQISPQFATHLYLFHKGLGRPQVPLLGGEVEGRPAPPVLHPERLRGGLLPQVEAAQQDLQHFDVGFGLRKNFDIVGIRLLLGELKPYSVVQRGLSVLWVRMDFTAAFSHFKRTERSFRVYVGIKQICV